MIGEGDRMNDLISRQAAIEKISETIWDTAVVNDVKTILKELPSAQPVQWISVKDRLPDSGTGVLVFTDDYCAYTAHYDGYWWLSGEPTLSYNVTHWMPLPAPPEVEEQ